jgi:hypothetical protein
MYSTALYVVQYHSLTFEIRPAASKIVCGTDAIRYTGAAWARILVPSLLLYLDKVTALSRETYAVEIGAC